MKGIPASSRSAPAGWRSCTAPQSSPAPAAAHGSSRTERPPPGGRTSARRQPGCTRLCSRGWCSFGGGPPGAPHPCSGSRDAGHRRCCGIFSAPGSGSLPDAAAPPPMRRQPSPQSASSLRHRARRAGQSRREKKSPAWIPREQAWQPPSKIRDGTERESAPAINCSTQG